MEYILVMAFICETGEKISMSLSGVKGDLTGPEVSTLMDTIIEKNIFITKYGDIKQKHSANLTEKSITKFTLA